MRTQLRLSATLIVGTILLLGPTVGPAAAQEGEQRGAGPSVEQITDSRLEQIVIAYLEISDIQNEIQAEIERSATPDEARQHQEQANQRILATLEALGIAPDEYSVVIRAVDENPDFRDRFIAMMDKVQSEQREEQEDSDEG